MSAPITGYTINDLARIQVRKDRETHARATGKLDPYDAEDVRSALERIVNGDNSAVELLREVLADYIDGGI